MALPKVHPGSTFAKLPGGFFDVVPLESYLRPIVILPI
jgi:hypothetical protein